MLYIIYWSYCRSSAHWAQSIRIWHRLMMSTSEGKLTGVSKAQQIDIIGKTEKDFCRMDGHNYCDRLFNCVQTAAAGNREKNYVYRSRNVDGNYCFTTFYYTREYWIKYAPSAFATFTVRLLLLP